MCLSVEDLYQVLLNYLKEKLSHEDNPKSSFYNSAHEQNVCSTNVSVSFKLLEKV